MKSKFIELRGMLWFQETFVGAVCYLKKHPCEKTDLLKPEVTSEPERKKSAKIEN
jgi:hypothetical protein